MIAIVLERKHADQKRRLTSVVQHSAVTLIMYFLKKMQLLSQLLSTRKTVRLL